MDDSSHPSTESKGIIYDVQTKWKDLHVPTFVAASSALYFVEQLVGHPLEVIRTRLQVEEKKVNFRTLKQFFQHNGVRSLYVGFLPGTVGYLPGNAVYFITYSFAKDKLQRIHNNYYPEEADGRQVPWVSFTAGMLADVAAVSLYCPVEVVAQRLFIQNQNQKLYNGTFDAVKKIAAQEGIGAFYKGFGAVLLNSLPASALWWTIYEQCKTSFSRILDVWTEKRRHKLAEGEPLVVHKHKSAQIVGGALAGLVISLITNPLDVIRTRLQTQDIYSHASGVHNDSLGASNSSSTPQPRVLYKNTWDAIKQTYRAEGAQAFAKGLGPRAISWVLASSLGAILYEFVVDISTIKRPD